MQMLNKHSNIDGPQERGHSKSIAKGKTDSSALFMGATLFDFPYKICIWCNDDLNVIEHELTLWILHEQQQQH